MEESKYNYSETEIVIKNILKRMWFDNTRDQIDSFKILKWNRKIYKLMEHTT